MLNATVSEEPVVVPPGKELCHILLRLEALHQLDDLHQEEEGLRRSTLTRKGKQVRRSVESKEKVQVGSSKSLPGTRNSMHKYKCPNHMSHLVNCSNCILIEVQSRTFKREAQQPKHLTVCQKTRGRTPLDLAKYSHCHTMTTRTTHQNVFSAVHQQHSTAQQRQRTNARDGSATSNAGTQVRKQGQGSPQTGKLQSLPFSDCKLCNTQFEH